MAKTEAPVTGELYKADGTMEVVTPADGKRFTADEQRRFIGGGRETLDLKWKAESRRRPGGLVRDGWILVVNEDARNYDLPINQKASELWGDAILGNALLCKRSATVRG